MLNVFSPECFFTMSLFIGEKKKKATRNDTHGKSMKIVQFSRPPTPLVHLRPKFVHPVNLERPISNKLPPVSQPLSSPNDNQSVKRKHNSRMTIICYQVFPSGQFLFSVLTH